MSRFIDALSRFLADRKGLLPLLGITLVLANFAVRLIAPGSWFSGTDLLLHSGIVLAIFGLLLARVL